MDTQQMEPLRALLRKLGVEDMLDEVGTEPAESEASEVAVPPKKELGTNPLAAPKEESEGEYDDEDDAVEQKILSILKKGGK